MSNHCVTLIKLIKKVKIFGMELEFQIYVIYVGYNLNLNIISDFLLSIIKSTV